MLCKVATGSKRSEQVLQGETAFKKAKKRQVFALGKGVTTHLHPGGPVGHTGGYLFGGTLFWLTIWFCQVQKLQIFFPDFCPPLYQTLPGFFLRMSSEPANTHQNPGHGGQAGTGCGEFIWQQPSQSVSSTTNTQTGNLTSRKTAWDGLNVFSPGKKLPHGFRGGCDVPFGAPSKSHKNRTSKTTLPEPKETQKHRKSILQATKPNVF